MLELDDLDLWYYFMILYYDETYDDILRLIFAIWIYVMMDDDEMMWDDEAWNVVVLFDTVMKWYEMLWKWTVVNDEMMEVDGMNLGVFVSSYVYIYTYIYIYIISLIICIYENIGTTTKCLIPFTMMIRRDPRSEPL